MSSSDASLLDEFCDAAWLEDGLSKNTLEAYRRDLRLFAHWLERERQAGAPGAGAHGSGRLDIEDPGGEFRRWLSPTKGLRG